VALRELSSIALVIANLGGMVAPTRDARRHYPLLMDWYRSNWAVVEQWLPLVTLRDDSGLPIDHRREIFDRTVRKLMH
jgi:hypothetical protein